MSDIRLRIMERGDWAEVSQLIRVSTNAWYQGAGRGPVFNCGPLEMELFCRVYEDLDPGCCVVAESIADGRLAGSCFFHPRPTHFSLGIMNVHPDFFGQHVASRLLRFITDRADAEGKPTRLVSSAMNLDSYSLYTRAGFVPRIAFQDMTIKVPREGLTHLPTVGAGKVRPARPADVPRMAELEFALVGIRREKDYRYFLENRESVWNTSVIESADGRMTGFLSSISHPASNMLGPGVARTQDAAAALILAHLDHHRDKSPVFLVPVECADLVRTLYSWGAKNTQIHFAQVRGPHTPPTGIIFPTFMPETG